MDEGQLTVLSPLGLLVAFDAVAHTVLLTSLWPLTGVTGLAPEGFCTWLLCHLS